jgi:hypothetical protein
VNRTQPVIALSTTAPINNDARRPAAAAAALVLHINRETLHHGAEIALLRDLCRWQLKEG